MREPKDEFFVGYFPTPPLLGRFMRRAVGMLLLLACSAAIVIAARQRDPGDAQWDVAYEKEFVGQLATKPYPMLESANGKMLLLVGVGKMAAGDSVDTLDGRTVRARGTTLQRSNLHLLEVNAELEPIEAASSMPAESINRSPVTLQGEIIDPKCFAGAMKPGDGKTHKACAALCLRGGIPPAFGVRTADGGYVIYLLLAPDGGAVAGSHLERLIARVGEQVELTGVVVTRGDLKLLRLTSIP
jgi:hypothetical protein